MELARGPWADWVDAKRAPALLDVIVTEPTRVAPDLVVEVGQVRVIVPEEFDANELCEPVLTGLRRWVDEELPRQIPKTSGHAAPRYLDNQWKRLVVFLEHAEIACHTNDGERDLRRPVKGRDNFQFAGSPRGAAAAAVFYTLVGTCLLQGMDPRRYLVDILGRLDEPPSKLTPHAVRERWISA